MISKEKFLGGTPTNEKLTGISILNVKKLWYAPSHCIAWPLVVFNAQNWRWCPKRLKKMSNSMFNEPDSLTEGVYVTSDPSFCSVFPPYASAQILHCQILADKICSWNIISLGVFLSQVIFFDQLTPANSLDQIIALRLLIFLYVWLRQYISRGEYFLLPGLGPPINWT